MNGLASHRQLELRSFTELCSAKLGSETAIWLVQTPLLSGAILLRVVSAAS